MEAKTITGDNMLEKYTSRTVEIHGYKTFVIDKQKIPILFDDENFNSIFEFGKFVLQNALELDFIDAAVFYNPRWKMFPYYPVNLYYFDNEPYFVQLKGSWMCLTCKFKFGPVIIHMAYHDSIMFTNEDWDNFGAKIDKSFPPVRCPQCNHFIPARPVLL